MSDVPMWFIFAIALVISIVKVTLETKINKLEERIRELEMRGRR